MSNNTFHQQTRILAQRAPWSDRIEFLVSRKVFRDDVRELYYAQPLQMALIREDDPGISVVPTFTLDFTAAQELMDALWQNGLRPTEGKGSAGSLAATERHLEDMRKICFAKLGVAIK